MSSEKGGGTDLAEPFPYLASNDVGAARGNGKAGDAGGTAPLWFGNGQFGPEDRERKALERGIQEGEARARAAFEAELAAARSAVTAAIEAFKRERESYFARIEPEVVQLALAIARKILHREAQMDPLLLVGMVHVALEKLDSGTRVRMRVHPSDIRHWNEYFAERAAGRPAAELVGDASLQRGECALETEIGNTQISLETQLKEIEQGFFDLLEQRPRMR
jgi:flagellar assembly protein FliH